ncbi:MAG: hypothetical protein Q9159_006819 [Coniocarpon cinnabarinum]
MPSRVSVRSSRSSATKSKRNSAAEEEVPDEGPNNSLRERVCAIFSEAQKSNTVHRKLVVGLRKVQEACCYEPANSKRQSQTDDFDENDFNLEVVRCTARVLPVRKSEPVGDRIIHFLGLFLKHATELDNAIFAEDDLEQVQGLPETPTSRLIAQIISTLLPLLQAKEKLVRFRCTQIIAHLINTLDSVDDELFHHIRLGLLKRLRDKESSVRVQAVCGLGRLAGETGEAEDPDDSDDDTAGAVLDKLMDVLQHDSSAEVRRALLLNLPFTQNTLPYLLERARDQDASIRRALYARLLPALGDFRHLSLTHREKLLRWGLRDRDENVRKATSRLFRERWIEDCARPQDESEEAAGLKPGQMASASSAALMELLERIDVVNAGNDGGIALDAMREFWEGRPDYCDHIQFDEAYWKELTPESVFIARTYNDHCRQDGIADALTEKLPEVTRLAFLFQSNVNTLAELIRRIAVEEDAEEDSVHQEFIVEQLLHIALTLDYSDEVGRRTMFGLMREALTLAELPDEATRLVTEVLKALCGTGPAAEREFCSVVLEAIAEVHDTIMDEKPSEEDNPDDSFVSAHSEISGDANDPQAQDEPKDPEKAMKEIMVNMKCLHIAQSMLQNVEGNLEDNSDLVTMLNNLVVPAVRSQEAPIRERGLLCLGLCCLLDKNLAEENLTLFLHCFSKGHDQLQVIAIQIIGDVLNAHPSLLIHSEQPFPGDEEVAQQQSALEKPIHKLFSKSLRSSRKEVQSTACAALSKLMLSAPSSGAVGHRSVLRISELLKLLVTAYFDPETASNSASRQALSYFIPVYCHSRKENMECMSSIALDVIHWYLSLKEELDVEGEDEADSELVGVAVVVNHLVDWTDGRKLALARSSTLEEEVQTDSSAHLDLAERTLDKLLGPSSRDERKLHLSLLGKLHVTGSDALNQEKVQNVLRLVDDAVEDKVASDATSRNALVRLQTALNKAIAHKYEQPGSSEHSRSHSIAPSSARAEDDATRDVTIAETTQALENIALQSTTTTPAASPRKRNTARTPRRSKKSSQPVYQDAGFDYDEDVMLAPSVRATPANSPSKNTRSRRTTAAPVVYDETESPEQQENIPPPAEPTPTPSPQKKSRGRPKKSASIQASVRTPIEEQRTDEQPNFVEIKLEEPTEEVKEEPMAQIKSRPSRAAAPRKSVRAGKRRATELDAE